ncbi:unknown protein [Waddlia chondrophila 2032/99]|uniref:Uncharacterized protein n=1 Tax=Waddlia chondrophila 2032/99 TaxID=765953 RepID=F8LDI9_9BACT|nr:unknown protein [Waddlia chondrophila 2032/99]
MAASLHGDFAAGGVMGVSVLMPRASISKTRVFPL